MQAHVPLPKLPDLLAHVEDIYTASVGCVGIVHTYLRQALVAACERNLKSVTWELIERFVDWKKVDEWNAAALSGERDVAPSGSLRVAGAGVLGLTPRQNCHTQPSRPGDDPQLGAGQANALHRDVVEPEYAVNP